jgi:hypothetical protein
MAKHRSVVSGYFAIPVDEHAPADKPTLPPLKR